MHKKISLLIIAALIISETPVRANDISKYSIQHDINGNGVVDIQDLTIVSTKYNLKKNDSEYELKCDVNKDEIIDIYDIVSVAKNLNQFVCLESGIIQEDNMNINYSTDWKEDSSIGYSGGKIRFSTRAKDEASFSFRGTSLELYGLHSRTGGIVSVYIDGKQVGLKSLYADVEMQDRMYFNQTGLQEGVHQVRIINTGGSDSASIGNNISIDKIVVRNGSTNISGYSIYNTSSGKEVYEGVYLEKDIAIKQASLFGNAIVKDSGGNKIWPEEIKTKPGYVYTIGYGLNVRSTPSTQGTILANLKDGTKVDILPYENSTWYKIKYGGIEGYVSKEYINLDTPVTLKKAYVKADGLELNARKSPSTSSEILGKIQDGSEIQIVNSTNPAWHKIIYKDDFAYVSKEYVSFEAPAKIGFVNSGGDNLNVRSGAGTGFSILGTLKDGSRVEVVDSSNASWHKIKYGSGFGYVHKDYITFSSASDNKISTGLINFIKAYEGFRAEPYYCAAGVLTIGYGHAIRPGESFTSITEAQATELLIQDLQSFQNGTNRILKNRNIKANQQQFDALVSFAYNLGVYGLETSDVINMLASGNYTNESLRIEMELYINGNGVPLLGLRNRRWDEWQMFVYGDYKRDYKYTDVYEKLQKSNNLKEGRVNLGGFNEKE
ncbi:MAG: SH3 domain-containing protein [Clostridium sp.]